MDDDYISRSWARIVLPHVALEALERIPTEDVQPARHGRWEKKHDDVCYWHECSECGERLPLNQWRQPWKSPYCPNCGAKML